MIESLQPSLHFLLGESLNFRVRTGVSQVLVLVVRRVCGTWSGALHLDLPAAAQAYAAVGLRVGEQSLADVVNLRIQLIWNVGGLECRKGNV